MKNRIKKAINRIGYWYDMQSDRTQTRLVILLCWLSFMILVLISHFKL